jgi:LacI family transcriptional regulator
VNFTQRTAGASWQNGQKPAGRRDVERIKHRGHRTPQVAVLLETSTEYGRGLLRGILRYSRLHGPWSLHVAPGHLQQAFPNGAGWKGTGIIARIGSPETERRIRSLRLPCVVSSLIEWRSPLTLKRFGEIRTDSEAIAWMGAEHLVEAGFRHFAFCGFVDCHWSTLREKAFLHFTSDRGFPCSTHRIARANWMQSPHWMENWQRQQPQMIRWVKSLTKPVGLMACNDACGRAVLQACATAGLSVPGEVVVIGVDNDEMMCELSSPPLSSVALDLEKGGYEAASLLDSLMKGTGENGSIIWIRPTHVVVRRSSDAIAQEDSVVARALQVIRDRVRHNLGINDVCEEVGVSRRTLERRFFRAVKRTVLSEIMRCRLERAKRLLLETDLPCYNIAVDAGFGSIKTFNRTFSRSEGTTPQNFRHGSRPTLATPPFGFSPGILPPSS